MEDLVEMNLDETAQGTGLCDAAVLPNCIEHLYQVSKYFLAAQAAPVATRSSKRSAAVASASSDDEDDGDWRERGGPRSAKRRRSSVTKQRTERKVRTLDLLSHLQRNLQTSY